MRRPHRSIETFDISLMAVVTKAMGAFLVLMLLLMPYYSSGPIGQKAAADLADKVEQADKKIREVIEKINTASAEDLRKLLDEALKLLDEARRLVAELKRANDALQAQVKRLEEEVAALRGRVAALQSQIASIEARNAQLQNENAQLRSRAEALERENERLKEDLGKYTGNKVTVIATSLECSEQLSVTIYEPSMFMSLSDGRKSPNILNFGARAREDAMGGNWAMFSTGGMEPGTRYMIARVHKQDMQLEEIMPGLRGTRLKAASADCNFHAALFGDRGKNNTFTYQLRRLQIKQGEYAVAFGELEVTEKDIEWKSPTDAATTWLNEKIRLATKEE